MYTTFIFNCLWSLALTFNRKPSYLGLARDYFISCLLIKRMFEARWFDKTNHLARYNNINKCFSQA